MCIGQTPSHVPTPRQRRGARELLERSPGELKDAEPHTPSPVHDVVPVVLRRAGNSSWVGGRSPSVHLVTKRRPGPKVRTPHGHPGSFPQNPSPVVPASGPKHRSHTRDPHPLCTPRTPVSSVGKRPEDRGVPATDGQNSGVLSGARVSSNLVDRPSSPTGSPSGRFHP